VSRLCWLLILPLFCLPLAAAIIQGTVRDPSGALVAGAQVTISSAATSEVKPVKADAQGHFSIDGLVPGDYQITVRHQGFETAQRTISIGAEPRLDVDIQLKIQTQETVVEVAGKHSQLANSDPNYRTLRDSRITETIRVENVTIRRDAGELHFRSGSIGFLPPVLGRIAIAVFTGQASFHLDPSTPMEANYLQMMTENRTLDEEFDSAVLCFTDDSYQELKRQGTAAAPEPGIENALRDFHRHMRHRTEHPRSYLEYTLGDEQIPNVEAELLAELYNPNSPPSFSAYLHGRRYHDLKRWGSFISTRRVSGKEFSISPISAASGKIEPPIPMRTNALLRSKATASRRPSPETGV
jgi:hypothetical protein